MQLNQAQKYAAVFIAALIFFLGGWYFFSFIPHRGEPLTVTPEIIETAVRQKAAASATPKTVTFDISGAVLHAGIYTLPQDSRVADAIKAAGGTLPQADLQAVNLAHKIADEEKIVIPAVKPKTSVSPAPNHPEPAELESQPNYKVEEDFPETPATPQKISKINLNSATAQDLEKLPGIGEKTAQKIIQYRDSNGKFNSPDDLRRIPGIGPAKLHRIRHYLDF